MNTLKVNTPVMSVVPSQGGADFDLLALFSTLWRGKWLIILCTFLTMLAGGYYVFKVADRYYPARAVVALETKEQTILDIESVLSGAQGGSEEVNTEVEVIRSRVLISRLVDQLNLVEDPEFNAELRDENPYDPRVAIRNLLGIEKTIPTETKIYNNVIDATTEAIGVSNIRSSLVFSISATTKDPEKSATIANTLANIYIEDALEEKRQATEEASKWLSEKAAELKIELEESEFAVTEFEEDTQLISVETLKALKRQLKEMRQRIEDMEARKLSFDSKLIGLKTAQASGDMITMAELADDARLRRLADAGDQEEFERLFTSILAQTEVEATRASQQLENLNKSELNFRDEVESQSNDLVKLQQLSREAEANRLLYESFLTRLKETSVQEGLQQPDSRLLSHAVPRPPSSPRVLISLIFYMLLGGMIGTAWVLKREYGNKTFRTEDNLETYTGKRVLGSIPRIKARNRAGVLSYARSKPTSAFAESVRNLRTSVLLSNQYKEPQIIMSTSSVPGEGKTTISLSLAQNMAGLGKRVLVLEGDVRKQIFSQYFDAAGKAGFMSVMQGEQSIEDAVIKNEEMGIDLLLGERSEANAADVFSSQDFQELLQSLRKEYDYIIIDTAPVLAVADARIIGQHADAIVYSVHWDKTTKAQVRDGLAMFDSVGVQVTGLVLSNINTRKQRQYGEGGAHEYAGYYDN